MQVILLERIGNLGNLGDTVEVRAGYARNYLLPQGKVLRATPENVRRFAEQREEILAANATRRKSAEATADGLRDLTIVVIRQASERGVLYGSVNARDIAEEVSRQAGKIDRYMVRSEGTIKMLGIHIVDIAPHPEISVPITVNVARSEEEAVLQADRYARGEDVLALVTDDAGDDSGMDDSYGDPTQFRPRVYEEIPDEPDAAETAADRVGQLLDGGHAPAPPDPEAAPEPGAGDDA
ncbi:MAG: 50S ribosomal protein L9 [Alphaproteobacteria bacterium]|nr:50S ribosomal protein L9 [Alphaproteobacteria bacterium]